MSVLYVDTVLYKVFLYQYIYNFYFFNKILSYSYKFFN